MIPDFLSHLPVLDGLPVPFFIAWTAHGYDQRIASPEQAMKCAKQRLCWICGRQLPKEGKVFFINGPVSIANRRTTEGPMHRQCATYAMRTCPFLTSAIRKYAPAHTFPEGALRPDGDALPVKPDAIGILQVGNFDWTYAKEHSIAFIPKGSARVQWWHAGQPIDFHDGQRRAMTFVERMVAEVDTMGRAPHDVLNAWKGSLGALKPW